MERDEDTEMIDRIVALLPGVIRELKCHSHDKNFEAFMSRVYERSFPLDNIAFLLFLDVVQWFSLDNTSQMRYSDSVKSFFRIAGVIFGQKLLRFLSGQKNKGQTILQET